MGTERQIYFVITSTLILITRLEFELLLIYFLGYSGADKEEKRTTFSKKHCILPGTGKSSDQNIIRRGKGKDSYLRISIYRTQNLGRGARGTRCVERESKLPGPRELQLQAVFTGFLRSDT